MRFHHYTQLESMDCGATSLRMIAKFYGKAYPASYLRDKCHTTREGVSMLSISDAAEDIGFRTIGAKLSFEQLCEDVNLPCIVHWNQNHFAVVYNIKKRRGGDYDIYIADPASDLLVYKRDKFLKCWLTIADDDNSRNLNKGTALLLEPTPKFYEEEVPKDGKLEVSHLFKYLKPYKRYIIQLILGLITGSLISLIFPFLTQSVVDAGIGNNDLNIVVVILVAQVLLTFGQTANNLIRSWLMLHVTTRISISLISDFLGKLMRLPISFFDSKMVGDIMQRIGDHSRIQSFLTGSVISIIVAVVTFVIYSGVMATYHITILSIFLVGSALYIGWILAFMKYRRKLDYMRFQEASSNQSNIVQLITGMQDIKLNNCEKQKRWAWESIQAKLYKISIKGLTLQQTQQIGGLFIDQSKNVVISFLAAKAVIEGDMTFGMMMAMQYIIGQLNAPLSQFIGFVQESQDAKISLERLNEIHEKEDEEAESKNKIKDIPEKADIILKNVHFQYDGPNSEKVLNGIDLTVEHGKVTAIVGTSGSGKTTLLKLLLGFYEPVEGNVLLGNVPLKMFSDKEWRGNCAAVMQEGFIFSDTIANNIGVTDEVPNMLKVQRAADTANIKEFIETLPLRYNTKVGSEGHGLSTGQKQRLLIARAAYKNAKYIIFDEATNSLDANNEKVIMQKLQELFLGKTVVIVAHRLSTVKNADKIVVLEKGKIIEIGDHAKLVERKGAYFELVRNQLELGS